MRVTSQQEDKQKWENCVWGAEKKENLKRWKVPEASKQQKRNQLVIIEKNNEPNQKSTEMVFNKGEDGFKILRHWR